MKNVLLLFARKSVEQQHTHPTELQKLLNEHSETRDVHVDVCELEDLSYFITSDAIEIRNEKNNKLLEEYALLYFRSWGVLHGHAIAAARYCQIKSIPFVDREVLRTGSQNKITQYVNLHQAGVPIPRTFIAEAHVLKAQYSQRGFEFPMILKSISGTRGSDNFLVSSESEMNDVLDNNQHLIFVMQEFIPNEGDYRVVVLGDQVKLVLHRSSNADTHLNNTSQGGQATIVDSATIPEEVQSQCVQAAQFFGRDISGVDLVQSKDTGKYYFFEVNRAPQLEKSSFESEKAALYIDYFNKAIDAHSK